MPHVRGKTAARMGATALPGNNQIKRVKPTGISIDARKSRNEIAVEATRRPRIRNVDAITIRVYRGGEGRGASGNAACIASLSTAMSELMQEMRKTFRDACLGQGFGGKPVKFNDCLIQRGG